MNQDELGDCAHAKVLWQLEEKVLLVYWITPSDSTTSKLGGGHRGKEKILGGKVEKSARSLQKFAIFAIFMLKSSNLV